VVESENASSWEYFLLNLQLAIPEISTQATTLISYRDKGLIAACEVLPPTVIRAFCCQHLKENFVTRYGRGLATNFWAIARARSIAQFESAMVALQELKPAAAEYLQNIDPTLWVHVFFPGRRYGHDASNIVESVNSSLKLDRELSIVELLNTIWHKLMGPRFDRYQSASSPGEGVVYTKFCTKTLGESRIWARQNIAQMADLMHGRVTQPNGIVKMVNLESATCSCGNYQENGVPCGHGLSCIMSLHLVCYLIPYGRNPYYLSFMS